MRFLRRCTVLLGALAAPAGAQEQPPIMLTTDTPEYCTQLARQVADRKSTLPDVLRLLAEGRDLCDQGDIRHGIRELRRALVILHRNRERPAPRVVALDKGMAPRP